VVVPTPIVSLRRRDFVQQSVATVTAAAAAVATTATGGVGIITTASNWIQPTISQAAEMLPTTTTATTVTGITLPPMGLGAWAWGDSLFWGCKWKIALLVLWLLCMYVWMIGFGFGWRFDRYALGTWRHLTTTYFSLLFCCSTYK
jgi:hypothetical protein